MSRDNGGPSVGELIAARVREPFERAYQESQVRRVRTAQIQTVADRLEETVKRVRSEEDGWVPIGSQGERELNEEDRGKLRDRARRASLRDPLIIGYQKALLSFVVGEGVSLTAATDEDRLNERVDEWWAKFSRINDWNRLEDEIPRRTWRDGEAFVRQFVQSSDGPIDGWEPSRKARRRIAQLDGADTLDLRPEDIPRGMTHVRLVPPEQVRDPKAQIPHGIITASQDIETVLGYIWAPEELSMDGEVVPAGKMSHVKIRVDGDVLRGRSLYEPLLKRASQYEDWLESRITLNIARSAIVLLKRIKGTPSQVSQIRDAQQTSRDTVNTRKQKMTKRGTVATVNEGIEYEYLSPNLQAADAQKDGRQIQLNMAAATQLPEYMFTADSSNANFASTLVSEAPAIREFESWRDFFEPTFKKLFRDVMTNAAAENQIEGLSEDAARKLDVHVSWPSMEVREELDHAKAQQVRHGAGILSKKTWAEDAGFDWEAEKQRIEQEMEDAFEFTPPPPEEQ